MKSLLFLVMLLSACRDVLVSELPEAEANDMVAALVAGGIEGRKSGTRGRFAVSVPARQAGQAWTLVRAAGLPRPPTSVAPDRLVVGPTEAALLDTQRQAQALERVLLGVPGVRDARVALGRDGAAVVLRGGGISATTAEIWSGLPCPPGPESA